MCTKHIYGQVLIDTLDWHLDRFSVNIAIDTWLTLNQHLTNSQLIVGPVSTNSYALIEN